MPARETGARLRNLRARLTVERGQYIYSYGQERATRCQKRDQPYKC